MPTVLGQRCTVFLEENSIQRFKIESSIDAVTAGDLPLSGPAPYTSNIFVHKIVVAADPKQDTFLRVGNVADLTTLPQGRETAVALNQSIYLSTAFAVVYDDVATASQAKVLIQQRVDNLIADWHNYNEQFLAPLTTPPNYSEIDMPLTTSEEAARKEAYVTAHSAYLAAKADNAEAQTDYAVAVTSSTAANDNIAKAVADSQQCSTILGQFNSAQTAIDAYRVALNTLTSACQTYSVECSTFKTACDTYSTASQTFITAATTYIGYGTSPTGGQLTTFTAAKDAFVTAKSTFDSALTVWNAARLLWDGYVTAAAAAVQAEALAGDPMMDAVHTALQEACTAKIAGVSIAATNKTTADKALADAQTAKKAADEALAQAELADTTAYLAVKALCPDYAKIVP